MGPTDNQKKRLYMKLNAAKIQEAAAWVEKNGLHPQPCGATLRSFCKAMGISDETFRR